MTPDEARTSLLGRVAAIRALMASYRGDSAAILPHARRALKFLPEQQLSWRSTAAICLGDAHFYLGDMKA
ncbi:MAG: hypothetical protein GWN58_08050, partial [Anaerolineae bacterium]|nr:hypothetical protein [Anaerolineae bacterium]